MDGLDVTLEAVACDEGLVALLTPVQQVTRVHIRVPLQLVRGPKLLTTLSACVQVLGFLATATIAWIEGLGFPVK